LRRERRSRHRPVQQDAVLQLQGAAAVQPLAAGGRRMLHVLLLSDGGPTGGRVWLTEDGAPRPVTRAHQQRLGAPRSQVFNGRRPCLPRQGALRARHAARRCRRGGGDSSVANSAHCRIPRLDEEESTR
ncbi:unnamed protein product, partial [Prorocentrum cordatum]